jgi:formate hydrogenlyase subunit 3/multisubunit Na+/H+ antiporter MnhD subunit
MDFDSALSKVLTTAPLLTCLLAALGLATVVVVFWQIVKPFFLFLTSSHLTMVISLVTMLIIVGCACWGYSTEEEVGACLHGGVAAVIVGSLHLFWQWLRHILKWNYDELEEL